MGEFKSLVVLDLETSGLPSNGGKTKVTELCMIGVLREHINDACRRVGDLPRIVHKLNVCFYPKKMIHFEATELTGLDNMLLEEIPTWDISACHLLSSFFQRLPPPVCVVAHNGFKFDFQVLKSEISAFSQSLPEEIMWADSLLAFRNFLPCKKHWGVSGIRPLDHSLKETLSNTAPFSKETIKPVFVASTASVETISSVDHSISKSELQKINETTPKRGTSVLNAPPLKRKTNNDVNEICELNNVKARKQLLFSGNELQSYKLPDIYKYIFDKTPFVSHNAETDVITLTKCIIASSPEIFDYFDQNYLKFSQVPLLW